jgi:hypothetical protein
MVTVDTSWCFSSKKTMKKLDFSFEGEYYIVEEKFVSKDNHKQ